MPLTTVDHQTTPGKAPVVATITVPAVVTTKGIQPDPDHLNLPASNIKVSDK